jgi:hypoxanthine phosphoribosyltransferase
MRHPNPGASVFLSRNIGAKIVNAGDGTHEHPTQALLDAYSIREKHGEVVGKKILIVDDINDTGATFKWISNDWKLNGRAGAYNNVRFAVLTENLSSEFDGVNYWCHEVNKAEEDVWLVYPWEGDIEYGQT